MATDGSFHQLFLIMEGVISDAFKEMAFCFSDVKASASLPRGELPKKGGANKRFMKISTSKKRILDRSHVLVNFRLHYFLPVMAMKCINSS